EVGPTELALEEGDLLARALDLLAEPRSLRSEVDHALEVHVDVGASRDDVGGLGRTRRLRAHGDPRAGEGADEGSGRLKNAGGLRGGANRDLDLCGRRHAAFAPRRSDGAHHADDGLDGLLRLEIARLPSRLREGRDHDGAMARLEGASVGQSLPDVL